MRRWALFALLAVSVSLAHGQSRVLLPSAYATYGHYDNGRSSVEWAGYATLALKNRHYLTAGYSDLKISHADWKYHQQMPVVGAMLTRLPFRVKAYYGHMEGKFTAGNTLFQSYRDRGDVGTMEAIYSRPGYDLGVEYAYFSGNGQSYGHSAASQTPRLESHQFTGRVTCLLTPWFSLTARHNFVHVTDGRKLYSLAVKAVYAPKYRWLVSVGGMVGERTYYFDNDLLVVFNQNDNQRGMLFGEVEGPLWKWFSFTAEYIYAPFEYVTVGGIPGTDYTVRYAVAGIKTRFQL